MPEPLKLMCILAHPDDESLGLGPTLARYGNEGIETYVICATRGEKGWTGDPADYPGPQALGEIREAEIRAAAQILGIRELHFLDYIDGELAQADTVEATAKIVAHIRQVRPQVVITFDPMGNYGHPDHIAICQLTTAATVSAAFADFPYARDLPPHQVAKLYYFTDSRERVALYERLWGDIVMEIDGIQRRAGAWESWAITARLDTSAYWQQVWQAITCHRSQLPDFERLASLPDQQHKELWGLQELYLAYSTVNIGHGLETDILNGLR